MKLRYIGPHAGIIFADGLTATRNEVVDVSQPLADELIGRGDFESATAKTKKTTTKTAEPAEED